MTHWWYDRSKLKWHKYLIPKLTYKHCGLKIYKWLWFRYF